MMTPREQAAAAAVVVDIANEFIRQANGLILDRSTTRERIANGLIVAAARYGLFLSQGSPTGMVTDNDVGHWLECFRGNLMLFQEALNDAEQRRQTERQVFTGQEPEADAHRAVANDRGNSG